MLHAHPPAIPRLSRLYIQTCATGTGNRASGKLQQQPAALASPHDDGDKMDSGLVATDFGDGILGVRTRKERVGAIPGIRKVHLSWGTGYFNQR